MTGCVRNNLKVSRKHMDWMFADVVNKIIELISKQVEAANKLSDGKITVDTKSHL